MMSDKDIPTFEILVDDETDINIIMVNSPAHPWIVFESEEDE